VAVATDAASEAATATDKTLYLLNFISSPLNIPNCKIYPICCCFFHKIKKKNTFVVFLQLFVIFVF
jgi:hypothetical protein